MKLLRFYGNCKIFKLKPLATNLKPWLLINVLYQLSSSYKELQEALLARLLALRNRVLQLLSDLFEVNERQKKKYPKLLHAKI